MVNIHTWSASELTTFQATQTSCFIKYTSKRVCLNKRSCSWIQDPFLLQLSKPPRCNKFHCVFLMQILMIQLDRTWVTCDVLALRRDGDSPWQCIKKIWCIGLVKRNIRYAYRRTSNYWIVLGEETSVYRGTRGSRRSVCGPNETLEARLSSNR